MKNAILPIIDENQPIYEGYVYLHMLEENLTNIELLNKKIVNKKLRRKIQENKVRSYNASSQIWYSYKLMNCITENNQVRKCDMIIKCYKVLKLGPNWYILKKISISPPIKLSPIILLNKFMWYLITYHRDNIGLFTEIVQWLENDVPYLAINKSEELLIYLKRDMSSLIQEYNRRHHIANEEHHIANEEHHMDEDDTGFPDYYEDCNSCIEEIIDENIEEFRDQVYVNGLDIMYNDLTIAAYINSNLEPNGKIPVSNTFGYINISEEELKKVAGLLSLELYDPLVLE